MAELSGLEVFALAKEIDSALRGTYVKNVYSLGSSQILRFGSPGKSDAWILASPKAGVWVSRRLTERSETTPFTTRLRQELLRGKFVSARQVGEDRVFDLALEENGERHLVVEMMPPGNIIVLDEAGKVLTLLNEVHSPSRRLVKGMTYRPPQARRISPSRATAAEVATALGRGKTVGEAIGRTFSLPRKYVVEAVARIGVEETTPSSALKGKESEAAEVLVGLAREATTSAGAFVCETPLGDEILAVAPKSLKVRELKESISAACDELLFETAAKEDSDVTSPEEKKKQEMEVTVSRLRAKEAGLRQEAAKSRESAVAAGSSRSTEELISLLDSAGIRDWKKSLSAQTVASALFDRAKEQERTAEEAATAAEDLTKKAKRVAVKKQRDAVELTRKGQEWYERFRWFITTEGKLAIGGRDAQSNSILVARHLDSTDTVYHADLFGSPFFVLKGGRSQSEAETAQVAQATVAFSSAWKTGLGAADAYWVLTDQVSRAAPSGEFLPKGGFMIKGKKNFVPRNLVEVAVGIDEKGRMVSGPESAISHWASAYVVLRPQKEKGSETAKRVKKDLENLAGPGSGTSISLDEVLRMLPTGGGKIVRKYRRTKEDTSSRNA